MNWLAVNGRRASILIAVLGAVGAFAPSAGAMLVHTGHGRVIGITAHAHLKPSSIPGSFASRPGVNQFAGAGTLQYGGGQVLHSTKRYVIYWDPKSGITAGSRAPHHPVLHRHRCRQRKGDQRLLGGPPVHRHHRVRQLPADVLGDHTGD